MEGESDEDTPRSYQVSNNGGTAKSPIKSPVKQKSKEIMTSSKTSSVEYVNDSVLNDSDSDHIYEAEPTPMYDSTPVEDYREGSVYENTEFPSRGSLTRKSSSPAILGDRSASTSKTPDRGQRTQSQSAMMLKKKPICHTPDDYEDPDAILDDMDYVEMNMDQHNTYIDPDDLRRVDSSASNATPSLSSLVSGDKRSESISSIPGQSK